jgi:hypothetical protein
LGRHSVGAQTVAFRDNVSQFFLDMVNLPVPILQNKEFFDDFLH